MEDNRVYIDCLAFKIGLAKRKVTEYYNKKLDPLQLTPAYVYVMGVLKDDGPCSLTHISKVLQLEKATVSKLLGRMERDGFISRERGEERRVLKVELTLKGKKVMEQALKALLQADKDLNDRLNGNLEQFQQLINHLNTSL